MTRSRNRRRGRIATKTEPDGSQRDLARAAHTSKIDTVLHPTQDERLTRLEQENAILKVTLQIGQERLRRLEGTRAITSENNLICGGSSAPRLELTKVVVPGAITRLASTSGPNFSRIGARTALAPKALQSRLYSVHLTNVPPWFTPLVLVQYMRQPALAPFPRLCAISKTETFNFWLGFKSVEAAVAAARRLDGKTLPGLPQAGGGHRERKIVATSTPRFPYPFRIAHLSDELNTSWNATQRLPDTGEHMSVTAEAAGHMSSRRVVLSVEYERELRLAYSTVKTNVSPSPRHYDRGNARHVDRYDDRYEIGHDVSDDDGLDAFLDDAVIEWLRSDADDLPFLIGCN